VTQPLPPNIAYWSRGEPRANFGDYLTELLHGAFFAGRPLEDDLATHLIGSVISDHYVEAARRVGRRIVFWGCGLRHPRGLQPRNRAIADIRGVRGLLSRALLDLPKGTPIGDPGLLLPRFHQPTPARETKKRTVCIRHAGTTMSDADLLAQTGAELVLNALIEPSSGACLALIDEIASASFVLTAALHGAVTAYAYGVPFAYLNDRRIDIPFKWADFSSSIGYDCDFVSTVDEGRKVYARNMGRRPRLDLDALLEVAPFG
jgi:hypothetical protein